MRKLLAILLVLAVFLSINLGVKASDKELIGAGATFPQPLYAKMFEIYSKEYGVAVNYQAIGSGGGIKQLISQTVDFGASDAFMSEEELKTAKTSTLHIPICLGAVVLTYNLPSAPELKLTPELIADIFLGKITNWNDPKIQKVNPLLKLPALNIAVVHRSDGSGTTFIFTDYLAKISKEWQSKVGVGKSINWPAGLGAKGNTGVMELVKQVPGSIAYVELSYTLENKMPAASIKNKSGNFIKPTLESTTLAAQVNLPEDTRVSLTDTASSSGYPISGFTWILVYKEQNYNSRSKGKAATLVNLLDWMVNQGQKYTKDLHYSPLPESAVKKAENIIKSITYNQKPLLQ